MLTGSIKVFEFDRKELKTEYIKCKETGVNSVLADVWTGTLGPLTNKAKVDMADVLGLKRKL